MKNLNLHCLPSRLMNAIKNRDMRFIVVVENCPARKYLICTEYIKYSGCDYFVRSISLNISRDENTKDLNFGDVVKMGVVKYNYLSPDLIPISYDNFRTEEEALLFYQAWKSSFIKQGYYSSNDGRISLRYLDDHVHLREYITPYLYYNF